MLDRGQEDDWFVSHLISFLAIGFVASLVGFVIWELTRRRPVSIFGCSRTAACRRRRDDLRLRGSGLRDDRVHSAVHASLHGLRRRTRRDDARAGAIVMILLMPAVGKLVTRFQARWLAVAGCLASAYAIHFVAMNLDLQIAFRTAATYRALQSLGLALLFIPINTASYVGVPEEKGGEVSGFIGLLRNVGGSVGISLVETMVARRTQLHQDELIAHVTPAQQSFRTLTDGLSAQLFHHGLSQPQAARQTLLRIYDATITQATVQSYMDVAWLIAVVCLLRRSSIPQHRKAAPRQAFNMSAPATPNARHLEFESPSQLCQGTVGGVFRCVVWMLDFDPICDFGTRDRAQPCVIQTSPARTNAKDRPFVHIRKEDSGLIAPRYWAK